MEIDVFPFALRMLRKERGLTQTQLAGMMSLSQRQISRFESGKDMPRPETVTLLRQVCNLENDDDWHAALERAKKDADASKAADDTVGRRIRVMRTYFKQSQESFAKELGISQSAMSSMEQDLTSPPYEVLCALGRMGFNLNWILYGDADDLSQRAVLDHVAGSHEMQKINKLLSPLPIERLTAVRKAMELLLWRE